MRSLGLQRPLLRLEEGHASIRPDQSRPIPINRGYHQRPKLGEWLHTQTPMLTSLLLPNPTHSPRDAREDGQRGHIRMAREVSSPEEVAPCLRCHVPATHAARRAKPEEAPLSIQRHHRRLVHGQALPHRVAAIDYRVSDGVCANMKTQKPLSPHPIPFCPPRTPIRSHTLRPLTRVTTPEGARRFKTVSVPTNNVPSVSNTAERGYADGQVIRGSCEC